MTLCFTDAATIKKRAGLGKPVQLSNGYSAELEFGDFTAADGTKCQARQSKITAGNHVAIVDRGRAGPECAIKDGFAVCDSNPDALAALTKQENTIVKTITVDGLPVNLGDVAAVEALIAKKDAALAVSKESNDVADAKVATLTAEKAGLEKQLADAKAELDPAKMEKRVADRSALVADAKKLVADIVTDGKPDAEIRKEIVAASLGDIAAEFTADQDSAAFAVLVKQAVANDGKVVALVAPAGITDARATAYDDYVKSLNGKAA